MAWHPCCPSRACVMMVYVWGGASCCPSRARVSDRVRTRVASVKNAAKGPAVALKRACAVYGISVSVALARVRTVRCFCPTMERSNMEEGRICM